MYMYITLYTVHVHVHYIVHCTCIMCTLCMYMCTLYMYITLYTVNVHVHYIVHVLVIMCTLTCIYAVFPQGWYHGYSLPFNLKFMLKYMCIIFVFPPASLFYIAFFSFHFRS